MKVIVITSDERVDIQSHLGVAAAHLRRAMECMSDATEVETEEDWQALETKLKHKTRPHRVTEDEE